MADQFLGSCQPVYIGIYPHPSTLLGRDHWQFGAWNTCQSSQSSWIIVMARITNSVYVVPLISLWEMQTDLGSMLTRKELIVCVHVRANSFWKDSTCSRWPWEIGGDRVWAICGRVGSKQLLGLTYFPITSIGLHKLFSMVAPISYPCERNYHAINSIWPKGSGYVPGMLDVGHVQVTYSWNPSTCYFLHIWYSEFCLFKAAALCFEVKKENSLVWSVLWEESSFICEVALWNTLSQVAAVLVLHAVWKINLLTRKWYASAK